MIPLDLNFTNQHQLKHRSIRFFEDRPVDPELLDIFYQVMQRTATSTGMQLASYIRITDPYLKEEISKVSSQKYITKAPELFIFLVDAYRHVQIAQEKGYDSNFKANMEQFFQGAADAYLTAQNLTNAVESHGLGATFLGSILNDPPRIIELLNLPKYTFPLVGVIFGYPADSPQLKPRMPMKFRLAENSYPFFDNIVEELAEYDETMTHYYDTREKNRRSDTFTDQVVKKIQTTKEKRKLVVKYIQDQGFDLML